MLIQGDAVRIPLPDKSVHTCVTSPPYWGLRKYSGEQGRGMFPNLGLEKTPQEFIERIVQIMAEVHRVLRDDGCCWWNYGDCYQDGNLLMMPHRIAIALQDWGWVVRNDVVWWKRNPMPESQAGWRFEREKTKVKDLNVDNRYPEEKAGQVAGNIGGKPYAEYEYGEDYQLRKGSWRHTRAHEYVFMLTKKMQYFANQEAVREGYNPQFVERYQREKSKGMNEFLGTKMDASRNDGDGLLTHQVGARDFVERHSGRNPRSVMDVPTAPYKGSHYACVDTETEALTKIGWKTQEQLVDGDWIACYDPENDQIGWNPATFHRYDYEGEMVSIEKRETSQLITPNHRCFVRRRKGHQGNKGWGTDTIEARNLKPGYELLLSAPFIGNGVNPIGEGWAALVGWFITDGQLIHKNNVGISQSLSANPYKVAMIRNLLENASAHYSESHRKRTWRGRPADMAEFVIYGNVAIKLKALAPFKKLTPRLANLPLNEARVLFDAMIAADGNVRKDGRLQFIQKDKECIDLFQLLAVRLGYKTVLSKRKTDCYSLFMTKKKWLTLRGTNGKHEPLPRIHYKGIVWCPSTPTGYWVARRNGRTFITGNTFPPNLIAPLIRATCPRWACPECGHGWSPVVEKSGGAQGSWTTHEADNERGHGGNVASDGRPEGTKIADGWATYQINIKEYRPTCEHPHTKDEAIPGIVLDPFVGSGTTVMVAKQLLRRGIGIDISMEYLDEQAKVRTGISSPSKQFDELPLFAELES